ncbi:unnamed protein product [Protopolystoma xenopodis]|uniref:Uncharacterized protein n=1 Tax=Protopolystoma xenopodis TaxID=117903 RepID=A0A3S5FGJ1_9PLAT|nr:unnamed protein product [Protopolystoma xenopodis]
MAVAIVARPLRWRIHGGGGSLQSLTLLPNELHFEEKKMSFLSDFLLPNHPVRQTPEKTECLLTNAFGSAVWLSVRGQSVRAHFCAVNYQNSRE